MKKLILPFLIFALTVNAKSETNVYQKTQHISTLLDRGLEVRYIKMKVAKNQEPPKEIKIDGVVYPLFKSKEDAYNNVLNASVKKDITIVYVISSEEKKAETIMLTK